jgi:hypothetical protein
MAIPSRVLGSGVNSLSTVSICGDGNASVTAAGTSAGTLRNSRLCTTT